MLSEEQKQFYHHIISDDMEHGMVDCSICGPDVPGFWLKRPDGRKNAVCAEARREVYLRNHYMRKYGMSIADVSLMLAMQDFKCKICKTEIRFETKCVDHCHDTGKVRGLLCNPCNRAIGILYSKDLLLTAVSYLEGANGNDIDAG